MSSSVKMALLANAGVTIAKAIGALVTGSASMAAESVHSAADCLNQILLLWGAHTSQRKPDSDHPLGYGNDSYFWSFIVALMLFSMGGAFSLYEGISKLMSPDKHEIANPGWALGILIFSIAMEAKAFSFCLGEIRKKYPNRSLFWFFKETRDPELLIVFGEDFAALIGLGFASVCLVLAIITGNSAWDAIGSILVGSLLVIVALSLFGETKAMLIGQSVEPQIRKEIHQFLASSELVEHTYECITLQLGNKNSVLMLRIRMTEKESAIQLIEDINELERQISSRWPQFLKISVEPDHQVKDF